MGAAFFIGWHFFMDLKWHRDASFDIVAGALIEFYLFTYIISQFEKREERKRAKEMNDHLNKIEQLIKRVYANQKDGE